MKCMSCQVEINPKWTHAININVCPFCGASIMEEHLKNLFSSLSDTLGNLINYRDQLDDWLLSNHNYIRTDSEKIVQYLPKDHIDNLIDAAKRKEGKKFTDRIIKENGEEEDVIVEKIQSEEKTNDFYKRAGLIKSNSDVSPSEKKEKLRQMAQKIKREGSMIAPDNNSLDFTSSEGTEVDPEAVAEYQSLISDGSSISSSLMGSDGGEEVPSIIESKLQALANKNGNNQQANADLAKLQQMYSRQNESRRNFENGVARGTKGGGFSRA